MDEKITSEPLWRKVLCWGAVTAYLTVPLLTYGLIVLSIEVPEWHIDEHREAFGGLAQWFQALTALVFGLAGLNTWDKTVYQRYNGKVPNGGRKVTEEYRDSSPGSTTTRAKTN